MKLMRRVVVGLFMGIILVAIAGQAHAYSVNSSVAGQSSLNNPDFTQLFTPVQNFFNSIRSVQGTQLVPRLNTTNLIALPPLPTAPGLLQGILEQFDAWFYGIAGFHILELFAIILSALSWILRIVQNIVNWLVQAL